jgi:hypothetical protein
MSRGLSALPYAAAGAVGCRPGCPVLVPRRGGQDTGGFILVNRDRGRVAEEGFLYRCGELVMDFGVKQGLRTGDRERRQAGREADDAQASDPVPLEMVTIRGCADRRSAGRKALVTATTPKTFVS